MKQTWRLELAGKMKGVFSRHGRGLVKRFPTVMELYRVRKLVYTRRNKMVLCFVA